MIDNGVFYRQQFLHDFGIDEDVFGQQDMAPGEACTAFFLEKVHVVSAGDTFELVDNVACKERFRKETVHPDMQRLVHDFVPVVGGKDNHRSLVVVTFTDLCRHFQAVHVGHFPVQKHQVVGLVLGVLYLQHLQGFFAAGAGVRLDARLVQHEPRVFAGNRVVIDDQHADIVQIHVVYRHYFVVAVLEGHHHREHGTFALL